MLLFDLLKQWEPDFTPAHTKVHLARYNGKKHPLDVFLEGRFDEWQSLQSQRSFEKDYVVSLIQAGRPTRWLFAGLFRRKGRSHHTEPRSHYLYELERIEAAEE